MLTAEPTGGVVWNANRGAISLRVRVLGKSAHVGLQHQGENAFERMHRVVERLQRLKHEVEQRQTASKVSADQTRHSILMLGGRSGSGPTSTSCPTSAGSQLTAASIPRKASKKRRPSCLESSKNAGTTEFPWNGILLQEGMFSRAVARTKRPRKRCLAARKRGVTGNSPIFEMCPGLLETRFYSAQGIPAYAYGPGLLTVAHGPNEYLDLRKVTECAAIYALAAAELLK